MTRERIITAINWFLVGLIIVLIMAPAWAQHECQGGHNCNKDGEIIVNPVLTGGDVGGDSSKVLAVAGADMEIADSLATHSILWGIWQGTHTNPYTEADKAEARGNHQAAAEMRCSTRKYSKVYGKGKACIDAVIYTEPTVITPQTPEDDARIEALYALVSDLQAERVQDKAEAEKAVETANMAAQRANAMARQVQTQQQAPDDWAERRAKARAAMKGEE